MPVENDPINEVEALVHLLRSIRGSRAEISHAARPRTELDLVLRDIQINQCPLPSGERCTDPVNDIERCRSIGLYGCKLVPIKEILELKACPVTEKRVITAKERFYHLIYLRRTLQGRIHAPPEGSLPGGRKRFVKA